MPEAALDSSPSSEIVLALLSPQHRPCAVLVASGTLIHTNKTASSASVASLPSSPLAAAASTTSAARPCSRTTDTYPSPLTRRPRVHRQPLSHPPLVVVPHPHVSAAPPRPRSTEHLGQSAIVFDPIFTPPRPSSTPSPCPPTPSNLLGVPASPALVGLVLSPYQRRPSMVHSACYNPPSPPPPCVARVAHSANGGHVHRPREPVVHLPLAGIEDALELMHRHAQTIRQCHSHSQHYVNPR